MKQTFLIGIVIVAIIIVAGVIYLQGGINLPSYTPTTTQTQTQNIPTSSSSSSGTAPSSTLSASVTATPTTTTTTAQAQTAAVTIQNSAFSPTTLTVKVGTTVTWTNADLASHTVTSDSGSELSSGNIGNGQSYSHTFNTVGTFHYHCSIHTSMTATVVVTA